MKLGLVPITILNSIVSADLVTMQQTLDDYSTFKNGCFTWTHVKIGGLRHFRILNVLYVANNNSSDMDRKFGFMMANWLADVDQYGCWCCLLYTSPSPRD